MAIIFKTNSVNPQCFLTLRCLLGLFSKVFIISKGRIHEFTWGHQPIIWAIFSENCMKIGPREGGATKILLCRSATPTRSTYDSCEHIRMTANRMTWSEHIFLPLLPCFDIPESGYILIFPFWKA